MWLAAITLYILVLARSIPTAKSTITYLYDKNHGSDKDVLGACELPSGYSDLAGADLFNCPSNDECHCDKGADVETVRTEFWRVCGLLKGVPMG
ncbi:hypothetical protein FA10DRAFT_269368 [Acaromyces ingoldii]|uniref:Extracellular membrane protein CFEM domain-containing protein n=1 Tax=Acaromyces ingoldii TaxID=215250 RepID=A0A316YDC0_9BASI|nr:hypothetical protein FA10DRAFT_269368 [Acaromyces ingoldii]PWN87417.1 hypothetical protein FA10DRAFT_269368 [Acaromyces ingoldii]